MGKMSDKELTDAILSIVDKINHENADKGAPCYRLEEMLERKSLTVLREMAKLLSLKGYSKMDKPSIKNALSETMIKNMDGILMSLDESEWDLIKRASKVKAVIDDKLFSDNYKLLLDIGYIGLYHDGEHFNYIMPQELKEAYGILEKSGFAEKKDFSDLLNNYAIAFTNLYGVILQDDFVEIFNSQNERKTTIDEMFSILIGYVSCDYGYCFWEDYIVNDSFEENDFKDVEKYAQAAALKQRYLPSKQELLKYSDWDYFEETPQLDALRRYLKKEITDDPDIAEDLVEDIAAGCRMEYRMSYYASLLEQNDIIPTKGQLEMLLQLIVDVQNNSRLWLNNGHTPNEIHTGRREPGRASNEPIRVVKIGRNDPCPCGSGKKYKKCCGR